MTAVLDVREVSKHFGDIRAVEGVSLKVMPGEIVSLIGPNGAGKTTVIRAILGLIRLRPRGHGAIYFKSARIDGLETEAIVRRGIAVVPEGARVFPEMSVLDNLNNEVKLWTTTPYRFLKRQASFHAGRWVSIENGDAVMVSSVGQ